jgi:hypothetical protein
LRYTLAAAVIAPAVAVLGLAVYSVRATDDWSSTTNDAPALALCGLFGLVPMAVGAIWLAVRGLVRRDSELHAAIACCCGLGAVLATIALGDAAAVGLGFRAGRVPPGMLAAVAAAWAYFVAVGLGHWHLSRAFR